MQYFGSMKHNAFAKVEKVTNKTGLGDVIKYSPDISETYSLDLPQIQTLWVIQQQILNIYIYCLIENHGKEPASL